MPRSLYFPVWHISARPILQGAHSPHPRLTVNTAKSPTFTRFTVAPISVTCPNISWPITSSFWPSGASARPPDTSVRSVPQIPTRMTFIFTLLGAPIDGSGRSTIRDPFVPGIIAIAFIVVSSFRPVRSLSLRAPLAFILSFSIARAPSGSPRNIIQPLTNSVTSS